MRRLSQISRVHTNILDDEVRRYEARGYIVTKRRLYGKRYGMVELTATPKEEVHKAIPITELDAFFAPNSTL